MHLIRTLLPRSGVDASREPLNERAWTSSGPEVESWTASGHATLQTPPQCACGADPARQSGGRGPAPNFLVGSEALVRATQPRPGLSGRSLTEYLPLPATKLCFFPLRKNYIAASVNRLLLAGRGLADPRRTGGPPEKFSSPPPTQSATVALVAAARLNASGAASLATKTCNPDSVGAPPTSPCSCWSFLTSNHPVYPRLKHLPDVGREEEEARCGEADVSAQSLIGALLGSCVDKPTIAPGKPARGFGETTSGGFALQDLTPELLLPPHYAVNSSRRQGL